MVKRGKQGVNIKEMYTKFGGMGRMRRGYTNLVQIASFGKLIIMNKI